MSDLREFPVLSDYIDRRKMPDIPRSVPWALLAPHEVRALRNHDQTLEHLARRGGLGVSEMVAVIEDRDLHWILGTTEAKQLPVLLAHIAAFRAPAPTPDVTKGESTP